MPEFGKLDRNGYMMGIILNLPKFNFNSTSVVCLMGPTAVGKSELALQIAENFPMEIISVDSAQIYCGMDIGTAKPDITTRTRYPHHLIDICDPQAHYSVAQFCHDAQQLIAQIQQRNKIPLLVGGTMLYFYSLQQGLSKLPSANPSIRQQLEKEAQQLGWPALHERLSEVDPIAAATIKPTDPQRIQRALEVFLLTDKPLSAHWDEQKEKHITYDFHNMALLPEDRTVLHQKIAQRFDTMLIAGFIDEVQTLYQRSDLHLDLPAIRSVGYRQIWQYLQGQFDKATMRDKAIIATRQLAKRQITWLGKWKDSLTYL